jgi:hypothetical protein
MSAGSQHVAQLVELDSGARFIEQPRVTGSPGIVSISQEVVLRWERHKMNLGLFVCGSQSPLEAPLMIRKQRQHGHLVALKALNTFGREVSDYHVGHPHRRIVLHIPIAAPPSSIS